MPMVELGKVVTTDGQTGTVWSDNIEQQGTESVIVQWPDGQKSNFAKNSLRSTGERMWSLPLSSIQLGDFLSNDTNAKRMVIPIAEESIKVDVRKIPTGKVKVSTRTVIREETVDLPLTQENIEIERVLIGRELEKPIQPYQEGDTWIIPVLEEVLVVEKRLVLREEIRLTTRRMETHTPQTFSLRSMRAEIERPPMPENISPSSINIQD